MTTSEELAAVCACLEAFGAQMSVPLSRADQRSKGVTYLRGRLLDGRRKSMQPMGARLGVDYQGLQQFVTSSTWDVTAARERLARRAVAVIDPDAWVVDDTEFLKDGALRLGWPGSTRAACAGRELPRSGCRCPRSPTLGPAR